MPPTDVRPTDPPPAAESRAERLKERVYITFTALAVVITLRSDEESAAAATVTLLIAVFGTLLAVFLADVVSHITVHARIPDNKELRHMAVVSFGSLGVVVLPFAFLGLAVLDVWSTQTALRAASIGLVAGLVAIGFLAARRVRLPAWQRFVVLFAEFAIGTLIVVLELWAHH